MSQRNKRGRPRSAKQRRARAKRASEQLATILSTPWNYTDSTVNAAALDMWRLGQRHQIGLHNSQKVWICRSCKAPLRPGISARIRIRNRDKITTCLNCGRVYRRSNPPQIEVD